MGEHGRICWHLLSDRARTTNPTEALPTLRLGLVLTRAGVARDAQSLPQHRIRHCLAWSESVTAVVSRGLVLVASWHQASGSLALRRSGRPTPPTLTAPATRARSGRAHPCHPRGHPLGIQSQPMCFVSRLTCIGHPESGERSAAIYTLLGSCRRRGLNPFDYLKDLFTRLPSAKITEIGQFTPAAWTKAKAKEKLLAQAA